MIIRTESAIAQFILSLPAWAPIRVEAAQRGFNPWSHIRVTIRL